MSLIQRLSVNDDLWHQYALKICGCKDLSNDLVNDMYLKLHDKKEVNKGYVYRTLKSILIDYKRENKNIVSIEDYPLEIEHFDDGVLEKRKDVLNLMRNTLTAFERETLLYTHEMSLREAEKDSGVPYHVLHYHSKKALKKMKANVKR